MTTAQIDLVFWLLALAALLYASAFAMSLYSIKKTGRTEAGALIGLAVGGFVAQFAALLALGLNASRMPLANSYELMEAVAWVLMLVNLTSLPFMRLKITPTIITLLVCVLTALPLFCPSFKIGLAEAQSLKVNYAAVHALLAVVSYALLAFSFVFSLMYVLQVRLLKKKEGGVLARSLLPLPRLVGLARSSLAGACLMMALSLAVGVVVALNVEINSAHVIKYAVGSVLFFLMLGLLVFSSKRNLDAPVFARLNMLLFILAILLIVPISIRSV